MEQDKHASVMSGVWLKPSIGTYLWYLQPRVVPSLALGHRLSQARPKWWLHDSFGLAWVLKSQNQAIKPWLFSEWWVQFPQPQQPEWVMVCPLVLVQYLQESGNRCPICPYPLITMSLHFFVCVLTALFKSYDTDWKFPALLHSGKIIPYQHGNFM